MEKIKFLMKHYEDLEITEEEAKLILESIDGTVFIDSFQDFIMEDLCLFRNQDNVINWFYCDDDIQNLSEKLLNYTIESCMVGRKVKDIILEEHGNYLKINDNLYVTWWI